MPVFDYNQFPEENSDYISWNQPGDQIIGTVTNITTGLKYDQITPCPELLIDTENGEKTLTAGQSMLYRLITEQKPQVGDRVRITYTGDEPTPKGGTMKVFTLEVKAGETIPEGPIQKELTPTPNTEPF